MRRGKGVVMGGRYSRVVNSIPLIQSLNLTRLSPKEFENFLEKSCAARNRFSRERERPVRLLISRDINCWMFSSPLAIRLTGQYDQVIHLISIAGQVPVMCRTLASLRTLHIFPFPIFPNPILYSLESPGRFKVVSFTKPNSFISWFSLGCYTCYRLVYVCWCEKFTRL